MTRFAEPSRADWRAPRGNGRGPALPSTRAEPLPPLDVNLFLAHEMARESDPLVLPEAYDHPQLRALADLGLYRCIEPVDLALGRFHGSIEAVDDLEAAGLVQYVDHASGQQRNTSFTTAWLTPAGLKLLLEGQATGERSVYRTYNPDQSACAAHDAAVYQAVLCERRKLREIHAIPLRERGDSELRTLHRKALGEKGSKSDKRADFCRRYYVGMSSDAASIMLPDAQLLALDRAGERMLAVNIELCTGSGSWYGPERIGAALGNGYAVYHQDPRSGAVVADSR